MHNQTVDNQLNLEILSKFMPGAFLWKKDLNSIYTDINAGCVELFGISKKRDISGFTDYEIPCKISEFAEVFRQHDQQVIATGKPLQILEVHYCSKDQLKIMLNTKNPLRDEKNNIVGTFAYCIDITKQVVLVRHLLSTITNSQQSPKDKLIRGSYLLPQENGNSVLSQPSKFKLNHNLTKRENTCLQYLVRGKTAKEISDLLYISKRTVEKHIEHIKTKLDCTTKSNLIDRAIDLGLYHVISHTDL